MSEITTIGLDLAKRVFQVHASERPQQQRAKTDPWVQRPPARKPRLVVAVALVNKMARIA